MVTRRWPDARETPPLSPPDTVGEGYKCWPHSMQRGVPAYPVIEYSVLKVTAPSTSSNHADPHEQVTDESVFCSSRHCDMSTTGMFRSLDLRWHSATGVQKKEVVAVNRRPLGPHGSYKTGQRVPFSGNWSDQYNQVAHFDAGSTFPPCIGRKGECAYRRQVMTAGATA